MRKSPLTEGELCLFVAGTPGHTSSEDLLEYFRQYGSICRIEAKRSASQTINFKLVVDDKDSFKAILFPKEPFIYRGRQLIVKVFTTGKELIHHNYLLNKRRVIAKNVPITISEEEFKKSIELNFGPISTMFCYKSGLPVDHELETICKRKLYSIVFLTVKSAKNLIGLGSCYFANSLASPTTFEKYQFCSKKPLNKRSTTASSQRFKSLGDIDSSCITNMMFAINEASKSNHNPSNYFLGSNGRIAHCTKPTSKKYFLVRKDSNSAPVCFRVNKSSTNRN